MSVTILSIYHILLTVNRPLDKRWREHHYISAVNSVIRVKLSWLSPGLSITLGFNLSICWIESIREPSWLPSLPRMSSDLVTANEFSRFSLGFDVGEGEIRLFRDRTYEIFDAWQPREFSPWTDSYFSCTDSFTRDCKSGEIPRRRTRAYSKIARFRSYHVGGNTFHDVEPVSQSRQSLIVFRPIGRLLYACSLVRSFRRLSRRLPIVPDNVALSIDRSVSFDKSWSSLARDETPWNTPVFISAPVRHPSSFHLTTHMNNQYFIATSNYLKITNRSWNNKAMLSFFLL